MSVQIKLYYDVVSPWAKIAYVVLKRYEKAWNLDLVLRPIYLGGVMVASGNKPPITVPNKGKWMQTQDMPLAIQFFGVKLVSPPEFPVNTINIVRHDPRRFQRQINPISPLSSSLPQIRLLRIVRDKEPPSVLTALTDLFFEEIWGASGAACAQPKNFPALIPTSVLSAAKLEQYMKESQSNENKEAVKQEATDLVGEGAFGFPYMQVTREDGARRDFFGSDRFEMMAFWLGKKWNGPFPEGSSHL